MAADSEKPATARFSLYLLVVGAVFLPLLFALDALVTDLVNGSFPLLPISWLVAFGAYYLTSVRVVQENEVGGIFVLQQRAWAIGPGYYFAPRFLTELHTLPIKDNQDQFPGNPEQISKRHDEADLNGMLRPFRIPTAGSQGSSDDDPLNTRMTLEPLVSVVWRLRQSGFFEMWIRIPGNNWKEKRANIHKQMYDSIHSMLGKSLSSRTPAKIFEELSEIDAELKDVLEKTLSKFGVDLDRVEMQPPDLPYDVNKALARIAEARADKQARIKQAEGEKQAEVLIQTGVAEGRERLAEADYIERKKRGEGDRAAAEALGMSGEDYRAGEIAKETVGEGDLVLGAEGIAQAVGLGRLVIGKKENQA